MGHLALGAAAAPGTGRLDQTLKRTAGRAAASSKVLRGRRLAIGLHDIDATGFGGEVHLRLAELHSLLGVAPLEMTAGVRRGCGGGGASINLDLRGLAYVTPGLLHGYRVALAQLRVRRTGCWDGLSRTAKVDNSATAAVVLLVGMSFPFRGRPVAQLLTGSTQATIRGGVHPEDALVLRR